MGLLFLGISYILSGIPLINIVGILLVPFGWILLGKKFRRIIWMITGFLGILTLIISIILIIYFMKFINFTAEKFSAYGKRYVLIKMIPFEFIETGRFMIDEKSLFLILAWFLIAVSYGILQLISLWIAGSFFKQILLKLSVVLSSISISLMIFIFIFPIVFLLSIILIYVANIIAGIGFLLVKYEGAGH